jgi:hypothetical protein
MAHTPLNNHSIPINLSESDLQHILEVTSRAYAESTAETYGTGLLIFHIFCNQKDIPEAQRAPANYLLLSSFIATLADAYSGKTITNYLYSVHAWHTIHGVPWRIQRTKLDTLLRAAETLTPPLSLKPKHISYTTEHLRRLYEHLDLANSSFDIAVFACHTTTFWETARLGETIVKTLNSFDLLTHTKPSDVKIVQDCLGLSQTEILIPHTKSAPHGETISWAKQSRPADPEAALQAHILHNTSPINGHLFVYRWKGTYCPLTKSAFLKLSDRQPRTHSWSSFKVMELKLIPHSNIYFEEFPLMWSRSKDAGPVMPSSYISESMPTFLPHICKLPQKSKNPSFTMPCPLYVEILEVSTYPDD